MIHASILAESENPLIPATYDLLWGTISFFVVLLVFWKYVLPTFTRVVAERQEKIEGGIENAKRMQAEAASSREAYSAQLEEAAKQAAAIRTSAHSDGEQIISAARTEALAAAAALAARAEAQIEVERSAAVGSLQRDVGALALQLASRIVGESLTDDARAQATVDRFIAELEQSAGEPGSGTP